jgi:hypothetical protein
MLELLDQTQGLWRCQPISRAGTVALLRYFSTLPDWLLTPENEKPSEIPLLKALCRESAIALEQLEVRS